MFCSNCGSPIKEGEVFCRNCGNRVTGNSSLGSSVQDNNNVVNTNDMNNANNMNNMNNVPVNPVQNSKAGKTNNMAIFALVFALIGLVVSGIIFGLFAISMGAAALSHFKSFPDEKGKGLAIAGIVVGVFDIVAVAIQLMILY